MTHRRCNSHRRKTADETVRGEFIITAAQHRSLMKGGGGLAEVNGGIELMKCGEELFTWAACNRGHLPSLDGSSAVPLGRGEPIGNWMDVLLFSFFLSEVEKGRRNCSLGQDVVVSVLSKEDLMMS